MLARRFTIVCILVALFGAFLSAVVEENARAKRFTTLGQESCEPGAACPIALNWS